MTFENPINDYLRTAMYLCCTVAGFCFSNAMTENSYLIIWYIILITYASTYVIHFLCVHMYVRTYLHIYCMHVCMYIIIIVSMYVCPQDILVILTYICSCKYVYSAKFIIPLLCQYVRMCVSIIEVMLLNSRMAETKSKL